MSKPVVTADIKEKMFHLREVRGWSYKRLALKFGISVGAVAWHCLKDGVESPKPGAPCYVKPGSIEQRGG